MFDMTGDLCHFPLSYLQVSFVSFLVRIVLLTDYFNLYYLHRLSAPPETLDQLGDSLALLEQLQQDLPNIEAKFPPLHQQFAILEKYEVAIPEEVRRTYLYV